MNAAPGLSLVRAYYRPIEAAIRWSGLWEHEREILNQLSQRDLPDPEEFPHWPTLHLHAERIFDALVHKELPFGVNGVTVTATLLHHHPLITIRHVDLKSWIAQYYPEERPDFLFQSISVPHNHYDAADRGETQKTSSAGETTETTSAHNVSAHTQRPQEAHLSARSETTYLHIIGALLELVLTSSAPGSLKARPRTQEAIIATLVDSHGHKLGIAQRTLEQKFAEAKRRLAGV